MTDSRTYTLKQCTHAVNAAAEIYYLLTQEGYSHDSAVEEMKKIMRYGADNYRFGLCCCDAMSHKRST